MRDGTLTLAGAITIQCTGGGEPFDEEAFNS